MYLVVISAHANTWPKCETWQGKILLDDVFSHGTKEWGYGETGIELLKENGIEYNTVKEYANYNGITIGVYYDYIFLFCCL